MTQEEAKRTMKAYGYAWKIQKRRYSLPYIYAQRREGTRVTQRYIAPLSKLGELTEQELISKLTR